MHLIKMSFPNSRCMKIKVINKLFDRRLSRWMKLWYKEITNTPAAPGIIKSQVKKLFQLRAIVSQFLEI